MPVISELRDDIKKYIKKHGILKKWEKAKKLFENNMNRLGVPQDRIAKRLGHAREMIRIAKASSVKRHLNRIKEKRDTDLQTFLKDIDRQRKYSDASCSW